MTSGQERPTPEDVNPNALGVDSVPDQARTHTEGDETDLVQYTGGLIEPTEKESHGTAETGGGEAEGADASSPEHPERGR